MMHTEVIGRLGADSEVKTSKNGNNFVTMRVASNGFSNGERTTTWVSVVWSGERALKMAQYMKKGSSIIAYGEQRLSIYKDKNGEPQIDITLMADSVMFDPNSSNGSNSGETQANEAVTDTGTLKPKAAKKNSEPQPAMATVEAQASTDVDDLPF